MSKCDVIGGIMGGVSGVVVGHPIDTVKVRQQVFQSHFIKTIKLVVVTQGWSGFFRGMGTPLVTSGAQQAIFFGVYGAIIDALIHLRGGAQSRSESDEDASIAAEEHIKCFHCRQRIAHYRIVHKIKEDPSVQLKATYLDCFIGGTVAGFCRLICSCPFEVVKVRLQSQGSKRLYSGPFDCAKKVIAAQGLKGLFVGGVPLASRCYGLGCYTTIYEYSKIHMPFSNRSFRLFMAGGTAGLLQWWLVLPLDVLKNRIQADDPVNPQYGGMRDCAKKIFRREGPTGFYRGGLAISLRAFPVNGATFLIYETVFRLCSQLSGAR